MDTPLAWLTRRPIAHRGYHDMNARCWENTLSAFEAAAARNFAIECDVHLAADGVAVVFHDDDLKRLTGREGRVDALTSRELGELAVGATRDCVPTLKQVLNLVAGRVPIIIELKGMQGRDDGLVSAVAAELAGYCGHAAIMSFNHHLIRRFAGEAPKIPAGLTAEGTRNKDIEAHFAMLAHELSFVSYCVQHLPNAFVTFVRERLGMPVLSWTIREAATATYSFAHADQMTFEGFDPDTARWA